MYRRPIFLSITSEKAAPHQRDISKLMLHLGHNSGNLLFSEAVVRSLPSVKLSGYSPTPEELEGRDVVMIAAANWLVIVGLGAQAGSDKVFPKIKEGTLRFLKIAADRSVSISTRGAFSSEVLESFGIKNIVTTGCPSLLLAGREIRLSQSSSEIDWEHTAIHATRSGFNTGAPFQTYLYRQSFKHDADLVLQSELPEIYHDRGVPDAEGHAQMERALPEIYGTDLAIAQAYLTKRSWFFWRIEEWQQFLRRKHFCIGSRIHGTIAGVVAGVPSLLISHDARTAEMAEILRVPCIDQTEVDSSKDLSLTELFARTDMRDCQSAYAGYKRTFSEFFRQNGLAVSTSIF